MALEETANAEMKEDDESVKGKAENEKAKVTDMRLEALEKVSETQQQQQLLASQQLMLRQQQDQTKAVMSLLDKHVNK